MFKRRLKLLGKILLGFIGLLVVFLLVERWRGQIALAKYKKELLASGVKLSPQDFVKVFKAEDNGAPLASVAMESLTNGLVLPNSRPPVMSVRRSGRAIVGFRESEWIEAGEFRDGDWRKGPFTNSWPGVAADLESNATVLSELRTALNKPILNNLVDYSAGAKMQLPHLATSKSTTFWLGSASQLALHEGKPDEALDWLLLQIQLPRLLAEDQLIISELVRIAISAINRGDTWEALQAGGWTDEGLLALQQAWEQQHFILEMARSFETERIVINAWFEAMQASQEEAYNSLFRWNEPPFDSFDFKTRRWIEPPLTFKQRLNRIWRKQVYCRIWRFAWSHQAQLHGLTALQALIEAGTGAATNKSNIYVNQSIQQWTNQFLSGGFYDRTRRLDDPIKAMPKAVTKAMCAETDRSLTVTAIALRRYFLRHRNYPASLDALVPEFLSAIPTDYMDGKPLKYFRVNDASFTLYSVGTDGRDDGGDLSRPQGLRSNDLWRRRDYVWPPPATPEEVEEYRREANKN